MNSINILKFIWGYFFCSAPKYLNSSEGLSTRLT